MACLLRLGLIQPFIVSIYEIHAGFESFQEWLQMEFMTRSANIEGDYRIP